MTNIFEQLQNNTIIWFLLALCTAIAIPAFIFAIVTRRNDNKAQEFSYYSKSNLIVSKGQRRIKDLNVVFNNKPVDNVTVTQIAIWNNGNKTIKREDIASLGSFTLRMTNNAKILNADIIYESDAIYCFKIDTVNQNNLTIDFEYVDPKKGIVLQLFQTGSSNDIDVKCSIKGGKPVKRINDQTQFERIIYGFGRFLKDKRLLCAIICISFFVLCVAEIVILFFSAIHLENGGILNKEMFLTRLLLCCFGGSTGFTLSLLAGIFSLRKRLFNSRIPSELRTYLDKETFRK